jgi:hypothetical protein
MSGVHHLQGGQSMFKFRNLLTASFAMSLSLMVLPFIIPAMRSHNFEDLDQVVNSKLYSFSVMFTLGCSFPIFIDMLTDLFLMPAGKKFQWTLLLCLVLPNVLKLHVIDGSNNFQLFVLAITAEYVLRVQVLVQYICSHGAGKLKSQKVILVLGSLLSIFLTVLPLFHFHDWVLTAGYETVLYLEIVVATCLVATCLCFFVETLEQGKVTLYNVPVVIITLLLIVDIVATHVIYFGLGKGHTDYTSVMCVTTLHLLCTGT